MSGIADRLAKLSPERRAALQELLRQQRPAARAVPPLVPVPRDGAPLPASFAQRRLWFTQQMDPRSGAYNMSYPLRMSGTLDVTALRRVLTEVVRRHEALRTTLEERGGEPVQVIHPPAPVEVATVELRGLSAESREREARRLAEAEARRPFDLARGPLLRTTLLRTGEDEAAVLFTLHHVVTDGWSMGVLMGEVSTLYAAELRGEEAHLPELPVQYADYAAWQRAWLSGEVLEEHVGWWRAQLAGAPTLLELPTDRPRPAVPGGAGAWLPLSVGAEVSAGLQALARREGATLFMTLLAAWQILLARYSGQDDVLVGTPIAGRNRLETERLIGFFVNTLVLRAGVRGEATFGELLGQVREATLGAYQHQELPFEKLVEELGVERSLAHTPLFQVMFSLQNNEQGELRLGGTGVEALGRGGPAAKFDLTLSLGEAGEEIHGGLEYRRELWEPATIERMAGHYLTVLAGVAAAPGRPLSELELLGEAERRQVVEEWNRTDAEYPADRCVHQLFEAQVERTPEAPALVWMRESLSYAELNERADRLAHHLVHLGVGPEVRVGIALERGPEMVAAVLAVLKAGGAYVPLDPEYPRERLDWLLADSGARVLLTQSALAERFAGFASEVVLVEGAALSHSRTPALSHSPSPANLAYVIYTSGSTGRPKGVLVQHGSLANLLAAAREAFGVRNGDVMPALASYAFDIWLFETLLPLTSGAAVRLVERERVLDVPALVEEVADATLLHAVPALMRQVAQAERERPRLGRLRRAFVGGDLVPADLLEEMRASFAGARTHVLYGPTEGTILASMHPVATEGAVEGHPIGRPLGNVRLYVCDALGSPQPAGLPGELLIGGAGVARGYGSRPDLTAERFVPDPFSVEGGARLYRTGDRVRWRASGELEFLGRTDAQVKVRGFRIEPGEIETVLRRHPTVGECVVVAREDAPGERRLVAYVVGDAEADGLREHVRRSLPEHMVPGAFVVLDRLPVTPNGKLDRKALPAPEREAASGYVAPRTPVEEVLAGIWAEVLKADRVGTDDGFFALGGHSLLATQVVSRTRQAFGVELPLRALFEAPTVAALAGRVEALRGAGGPVAPPIEPVSRAEPLPLSFAQQRLWLVDRIEPGSAAYNMPFALRLRGALDARALERSLTELVGRHEALRTTFAERDGAPVQHVHPPAAVPLPLVDLRGARDGASHARRLAAGEALRPFDLARGPLLRSTLLRLGDEDHVLLFTMHHVVSDAWSMDVLVRELSALYTALGRGEAPRLPGLPVQYADFAVWQRAWLSGGILDEQIGFWKEELAGAPPLLEVPTDRPRRAGQSPREASHPVALPPGVADGLRSLSRREGTTLFMTTLAAWQALLGRWSGQDDVVVGSPVAGRTRLETEGLIGFFVNMLCMRADLAGDPTWSELLARVREAALGAYAHQELPFERLVEELGVERSLTHTPVFQVTFALQRSGAEGPPALGELELEPFVGGSGVARYDLGLVMTDGPAALGATLSCRESLFEAATAARMAGHFAVLLEAMAAGPGQRLSQVPLLRGAERAQVLEEWNAAAAHPAERCVHELFERQVERTPGAVAVEHGGDALSYAELNARANRLARRLRELGVGPDARVAICAERGLEMIVGVLAVLKAGGAYVPLDPAYPAERLRYVLRDSSPVALLTQARLAGTLDGPLAGLDLPRIDLDAADAGALSHPRTLALSHSPSPDNLAYVIYTSGSTGRPKGVQVTHANVVRLFDATQGWFGFGEQDVWTLFHSFAFDFSVWEIWGALLHGGRLVVVPQETARSAEAFYGLLCRAGVTVLNQTPSAFRALMTAQAASAEEHRLKWVVFGGEALEVAALRPWFERNGEERTRLVNMYGITETTVHVTYRPLARADVERGGASPVGRRIPDLRTYVLDGAGEPVPVGVAGELYVGGGGVARGYLGRPELTAERFVPDPFGGEAGARLYRSGDRVRWVGEGEMEYLGRTDQQVKVRGFRIEPGEIEARLEEHPEVREAVVVAREDAPGDRRLVAYFVGAEGVGAEALRAHLSERLPEHMVPAAYVRLAEVPLTVNGKLDRRALPAPEGAAYGARAYQAPVGATEAVLAEIWAETLGVERVGRWDHFFELGGHSLLVVRAIERMRQRGLHADVRALFTAPTLAELAAAIGGGSREVEVPANGIPTPCEAITPAMLPLVELTQAQVDRIVAGVPGGAGNVQDVYPLAPLQEGMFFHHLMAAEGDPYLMSTLLGFDSRPLLDAFLPALQAVIGRHDILRTAVMWEELPEPVQVVWREAPLPVEEVELDPSAGDAAAQLRERFDPRHHPIDLRRAPLLRGYAAHDRPRDRWLLLLLLHHLVDDNTSLKLVVEEVRAHLLGEADRLPAPLPFRNFVAQARLGVSREEHEAFFTRLLGDVEEPTAPFGMLDVHGDAGGIAEAYREVEAGLGARLREAGRRLGVSAASVCHVAWAAVLARVSGRRDVVFGTVLFGRMQGGAGADRVIGPFINTLPVRLRVGRDGAEAGVRAMHALLAELLRHEHASLALVQRCSGVRAPTPLFSALLNYRHVAAGRSEGAVPGELQGVHALHAEERTNYPLALSVDDLGDGFSLTAQAPASVGPERVCALAHTALERLVEALESAPGWPLDGLDVLPQAERRQVVEEWNRTEAAYPADRCVHQLFEAQAERTPDAVAVTYAEGSLTYRELDRRADRLARHLRGLGVGPDARVALCLERGPAMMVGLLGILKAGGAYVPLDPAYPAERLAYMLEDSAARVLLTDGVAGDRLAGFDGEIVAPDTHDGVEDANALSHSRTFALPHPPSPDNLAYVIYTSGSTGRPKGVAMPHRPLVNLLAWQERDWRRGRVAVTLQFATISFDASFHEVFSCWCTGGRVVLIREEQRYDPAGLLELMEREGVERLFMPAVALQHLAEEADARGAVPSRLEEVQTAGEALRITASMRRWLAALGAPLHNHYGPSETHVVTARALEGDPAGWPLLPGIGGPIANSASYVLDGAFRPAPVGVPGELYLGGVCLARGYLERPELTAERFVPDPFLDGGARMYRSGDRVRWLATGELEFLGRVDQQVKVRGFRIEPGEVEAVLEGHPQVREAVVSARGEGADRQLVAYVVADGVSPTAAELREHVRGSLPDFMVPGAMVLLAALPLTPSGKVDRRALPAPDFGAPEVGCVGPRTPAEEVLAGIWAETLRLGRVGVEQSFFDLGGHSLLAMQVVLRARQAFGVELPLRALFEAPTVAGLAGRVEALRGAGAAAAPPIERVPRGGALPLSFAQQRLWLVDRLEPGSAAYNMPYALRLRGALRADALRAALDALVRRHETLRTTFAERGDEPVQVIHAPAPVELDEIDLRELPEPAREAAAGRLAAEEALRPFDLARGPLLRCTLLRLADDDQVLLFTLHHVVSDGWSLGVLVREVSALYGAFSRGEEPRLPELPVQYADFAVWQRQWLQVEVLDAQIGWWKERLAGAPPLLEIPTDRPRSPGLSPRAESHAFRLPPRVSDGLREIARGAGATLFMTVLAGWQALLARYAGQDDVVVGSPIAGRSRQETEGLIGFFVNMLALRADLAGDPTWTELLGRVRETTLGAYDHQELPFERLVDELSVERSLAHSPVFQTIFTLDVVDGEGGGLELGELEPFGRSEHVAKFDLDLVFADAGGRLDAALVYRAALFDAETVARMAGHLETLLEAVAADPARRLSEVSLLREAERAQLLAGSRAEPVEQASACVHELFAAQAARTPELTAVRGGGVSLSYAELDRRSNRLAHLLRSRGVGPESRVGICLERGVEMVVAVLGVLKAGGAYVPLDPAYPAERLAYTLGDSGAAILVSRSNLLDALPSFAGEVVRLDRDEQSLVAEPDGAVDSGVDVHNAAYVIYTSGSTGLPKGVVVQHASLANTLLGTRDGFGLGAGDVMPALASYAFDIWGFEVFAPLLAGGEVRLPSKETVRDVERLVDELTDVDAVHAVPALMREIVARVQAGPGTLPRMRRVYVGGDAVPPDLIGQMRQAFPAAELRVLYGPTEASILGASSLLRAEGGYGWQVVGHALPGVGLYVCDAGGSLLPAGVPGELWIGGAGVARGYLGRAGLTAERFVPDAFSEDAGARAYRTGDRVRRRADGELEFLGRIDSQVKVRGFRIEPGEVEAALLAQDGVGEAVVAVREDAPGGRRLVAYVVPREAADVSTAELRARLTERLPEHMVPGAFVLLEKLPLSPSGKTDRRALPAPSPETAAHVAPRTATEEVLAGIWADVLETGTVGAHDNFFALGGHSLLATRVVSRARRSLGVEVPLRALFEAPTVAELAARIEDLRGDGGLAAPPMEHVSREAPLPLSFAQQRLWVVDRIEPGSPAYNMPFALRLRGALDVAALRAALDALVRRHETLRTTFAEHGGEPVQVIHPPAPVALPLVDLRGVPESGREAERLAGEEAMRPFDLARGPLLRGTLLRLGGDDHVLCLNMHHIVSDGWSMQVLTRELTALYDALSRGEEPRLPELPLQYADYAVWQRHWLQGETLEGQIGYWKVKLSGAPPLLEIPTDHPRAPGQSPRAASHAFHLPPELSRRVRELSRREGATLFMTLLAGWQALLGRYSGQDDVVVGSPIAGRNRHETEGLIGFFVNMLALRTELGGGPTGSELLERVRETALGAYDHQELPFERLVEELGVERSLTHSPVFQTIFTLHESGVDGELPGLGGLALEPYGAGGHAAKFDLDLVFGAAGEGLGGVLSYRTALFDAPTIARMAEHLEAVLDAMAADPRNRPVEVSLLREAERAQLLAGSCAEPVEQAPACVHELFAAQAARTPGLPAVQGGGEALSYAGLDRRSNRLAHLLRSRGVGPESRVGICLERGVEMVVAVLGVLKAGGAYVPLDPAYPAERLAYTLADSGAALLISRSDLLDMVPEFAGEVVRLDRDEQALAAEPDEAPESGVDVHNAAYVIYTSGSTGLPKGVVVEHASLANTLLGTRDSFGLAAGDVMPALASYAFDIWGFEVFAPLLAGGEVRLPSKETVRDVERLVDELADVDAVHAVPALMREIVARVQAGRGTLPRMRRVYVGGDAVPPDLIGQMRQAFPAAELRVLYGPTEASILGASSLLRAEGGYAWQVVGRALPGVGLYVCDPAGSLLPAGVPGELWIGGAGVARGYLGRAGLTAERFVPDAFGDASGARAYRTGDRVRRRADGELEFLGRIDTQVKVRGFRIEPGEIEAALLAEDGVGEAVVAVRDDVPGGRRLVAYVVPREGAEVSAAELRGRLAERLPEHMVPAAFVTLERLPLNANGKLDRRALPAPELEVAAHMAPRTAAEEVLAGIWVEVLGTERVGVEESFFELGGHSLLATQVVSRVRQAFGVEVPLKALFEAPTVAGLAARIEELRGAGGLVAPPIEPVGRTQPLPLSFAQQRLWVVDRIEPGSAAYNMPFALRLRGLLDIRALERSLTELVRRHETLRTTFSEHGGEPVQVVHAPAPAALPVVDLRGVPEAGREAERLAEEEGLRPFDLARGPLLRGTLLRLGGDDHVLCLNMHHIVSDGWSMQVLTRELTALYASYSRGEAPRLPELPVQYADYAVWQRRWLRGETLEAQIGYWKRKLSGAPPLLEIPTDRPRALEQVPRAASHAFHLSPELSEGLRALSRREGATLFMTLLAGWQALLGRYAGQDDVVVGSPIAGRSRRETEGLIGFFVNMLVLRADLSADPTWTELLGQVREAALGAYDHQELPFERLVEELEVERSLAHSPVFQVVFSLDVADGGGGAGGEGGEPGGLAMEPFGGGADVAKFDLDLGFQDGGGVLAGMLQFRAALFDAATVARMAGHLETLLGAMASTPERRLSELSLLSGSERVQVLEEWNATAREYPRDMCLHETVAAQARRTPDAPALVFEEQVLTYAELDAGANRLAHLLRRRGVGPEARVAIAMERSQEMVVAVLGVLKAGGAYVPLDPAYPAERAAYVLADSGAALVLTQAPLAERFAAGGVPVLAIDALRAELAAEPAEAPATGVAADNLAYVIYTSGSTGQPKGVLVQHGSAVNYTHAARDFLGLTARDRVIQFHSLSFDVAVEEIFATLLVGAALVLRTEEMLGSAARFFERCAEWGVTVLELPTAYWHELAAALDRGEARLPACVRLAVVGGERMLPERAEQWRRSVGDAAGLVNGYGPTEATIVATMAHVGEGAPSIGGPVANVRAYVLDPGLEPAPVGVPGELWIGGAGVARGYLGRPGATAERFAPDPFPGPAGARMYRSGDRVRWLPTGELEYLGRIDAQAKVRGFRIEPGEVEAVLREHAAVRDAVVVVRAEEQRLAAYVVPEAGTAVDAAELRAHAAGRLPEYMVPGAIVLLEALPLTVSGKVDRRALPAPDWKTEQHVAPRTAAEEVLAGIWAEVLGRERVGVEDGFFDLGGHSLLATRVVSRARQAFGVEVPLRTLFEAPTVAALAGRIEGLRRAGAAAAPPLERASREGPLPLSFAQQRLWLMDRIDPGSAAYNMPFALRLHGTLDVAALRGSLGALVRRHEALRTTFAGGEGGPVQVIHPPAPVPLPLLDLGRLPGGAREREAGRLAGAEAMRPFELARGPLLRAALLRLDDGEHVLLLCMHHVVSDGWSMDVLVRELSALYDAASRGGAAALPELPVQYADYAVWQRQWLSGRVLEEQIGFWKERLAGAPPLLEIPTDRPRAPGQSPRARSHGLALPAELSEQLRSLSRREGATLFMTLLAGWQALLGRYAGQDDVVVGTPIAGRTRRETEGLIGFFVNMLALRADLGGDPTWAGLLARVREAALGAYDHQELPFERLVEELGVERSLTHAPVFQATFSVNPPAADGGPEVAGDLALEPFGGGESVAKFDLDLVFADTGEGLGGMLVYRPALFDAGTIERMAAHLELVLGAMAAGPRRRLSGLSLLGTAERAQLLREWNATAADYPRACFHEQFAERAARAPEAPALAWGASALSYGELEHAANRLANHLRRRGVGPETRVAVCLERGPELVVALLGVLKAGGVYVPLDPAYPAERLALMLADSGAHLLLTRGSLLDRLPAHAGGTVRLDADAHLVAAERPRAPDAGVLPENLAYVVYTSGSTGRPKGVLVPHGGLANVALAQAGELGIGAGDRLLQFASSSFDASVSEITMALASGATLVLGTREALAPGPDLLRFLREAQVTAAILPPAALAAMAPEELPSLRTLAAAGEACPADVVERWAPGRRFFNLYGPTEATICSTAAAGAPGGGRPPIGRPVANTTAYVLDPHGEPVPVGVPGELYVGGAGVARGYGGRPALTAERFVPDPLGEPGARLYRTGDRARWLASGELDFLGRTDAQLKVRAFRIEPGEIESALRGLPEVEDAVVVAREDAASGVPGDRRLVAYLVPRQGAEPSPAELRARLAERLPEYMVPGHFVTLERIPLTPNGKLDRGALPRPDAGGSRGAEAGRAPRDRLEAALAGIFAEVLGAPGVGIRDGFFELGGHSLLAVQLVSRVEKATGVSLPVAALFRAPTVERLAEEVRRGGGGETSLLVPVRAAGSRAPLFLVHPAGGSVMAYAGLAAKLSPEQPVLALRSRGTEPGEEPNRSVEEMARDYLSALRAAQPSGPYRLGGWSMGGVVAFEMARQLETAGEEVERLLLIDSQVPRLRGADRPVPADAPRLARMFAQDLGIPADALPPPDPEASDEDEDAYLRRLLAGARAAGLLPAELDPARMQRLFGIYRINVGALNEYRPESYGGRATLLRAGGRGLRERLLGNGAIGWERVVRGGVEVRMVPGTHYTVLREPQVEVLARELERELGTDR